MNYSCIFWKSKEQGEGLWCVCVCVSFQDIARLCPESRRKAAGQAALGFHKPVLLLPKGSAPPQHFRSLCNWGSEHICPQGDSPQPKRPSAPSRHIWPAMSPLSSAGPCSPGAAYHFWGDRCDARDQDISIC